jgi:hypothetical protein
MTNTTEPRRTARGHLHAEAFCLMWYACECGHEERIWNSRDGVTPFGMQCPSCGKPDMFHRFFGSDTYAPDHKPNRGQRVWIDMTLEQAQQCADARIVSAAAHGHVIPEAHRQPLISSIYQEGRAPDLVVWGYQEQPR